MSDQPTQHELAHVLGRLHALRKRNQDGFLPDGLPPVAEVLPGTLPSEEAADAAIPVLTEVYTGILPSSAFHQPMEATPSETPIFMLLEEEAPVAEIPMEGVRNDFAGRPDNREALLEQLLQEMRPVLDQAIREAVIHALASSEAALVRQLEEQMTEIMQARLQALLE